MEVNGLPASVVGTTFAAANLPLFEGSTTQAVVAMDGRSRTVAATVQVIRDSTAHPPGDSLAGRAAVTTASTATVSGIGQ
jgi:hypothetical protein